MPGAKTSRKILRRTFWAALLVFAAMNLVAIFHSYRFTHFSDPVRPGAQGPGKRPWSAKFNMLIFGLNNPRPINQFKPSRPFETVDLQSNKKIECWYLPMTSKARGDTALGTVVICHGYGGEKSLMLGRAEVFDSLKYNTLLLDFMGCGGSEGSQTTVGYKEAEEVKTAFEYLRQKGQKNIYLFGTSMGAVAILKAMSQYHLEASGLILECPFGSMEQVVDTRFRNRRVPKFPMKDLLIFWGGLQNGFWSFGFKATEYAKSVSKPCLLLYGLEDQTVTKAEIDQIYQNLRGVKSLKVYPHSGHDNLLTKSRPAWIRDVSEFLKFQDD